MRKKISGQNDLLSAFPELAREWHPSFNGTLNPSDVCYGSTKKVWWQCPKGHAYEQTINNRTNKGSNCPYCSKSNRKVLKGENDLQTLFPNKARLWDYNKNQGLSPCDVLPHSQKRYWWKCDRCGNEWPSSPDNIVNSPGCPNCTGHGTSFPEQALYYYVKKIYPDAERRNKEFGLEMDVYVPSKRIGIEYDGIYFHKHKSASDIKKDLLCAEKGIKLYRIREKGLEPLANSCCILRENKTNEDLNRCINAVLIAIGGLPIASVENDQFAILEQYYKYIKEKSIQAIYPELAKEWHPTKNGKLTPDMITYGARKKFWWLCKNGHDYKATPNERAYGKGCPYCAGNKVWPGFNDLETVNETLSKEWDYDKNGTLKPSMFTIGSHNKVWWKCSEGHEWIASICDRSKRGCPYCARKRVLQGYNDFATTDPDLAKEWNHERNGNIKPSDVTSGCHRKVWWTCPKGHEWPSTISNRKSGNGCPVCANQQLLVGFNDLATTHPEIAKEWHPLKNGANVPSEYVFGSHQEAWWKCENGHEWKTKIYVRTSGHGCPFCSGKKAYSGENDLLTTHPDIAAEWDYEKNGDLKPENFKAGSNKQVWWKCRKGHEWKTDVYTRTSGHGCPECAKSKKGSCGRKINQYDLEGHYIKTHLSISDAAKEIGCSGISNVLSRGKKQAAGYQWRYDEGNHNDIPPLCIYKIAKVDVMTGKIIKKYSSMRSAEKETGIDRKQISLCCNGLLDMAGGYLWTMLK